MRAARIVAAGPLLRLQRRDNGLGHPRVGITVAARLGGAVQRNRLRRRLRAIAAERLDRLASWDLVVIATPAAAAAGPDRLGRALDEVLRGWGAAP